MRSLRRLVPSFSLYGEHAPAAHREFVHIEDIQSRSRKYLWQIGTHRHAKLSQCVLVTAGPASVVLEELRAQYDSPVLIIIPEGTIHSFRFRAETQGFVLTVNLPHLTEFASPAHRAPIEQLFSVPRAIDLSCNLRLVDRAAHLLECLRNELRLEQGPEPVANWLACSVLYTVTVAARQASMAETFSGPDLECFRRLRQLIESRYAQHWPVERFARELGVSETSLNRLCRRLAGNTVFDLLQQRLALEARRRLIHARDSVSGIASALGFKDSGYFSRFFRRHSGVSPRVFRGRHGGG